MPTKLQTSTKKIFMRITKFLLMNIGMTTMVKELENRNHTCVLRYTKSNIRLMIRKKLFQRTIIFLSAN